MAFDTAEKNIAANIPLLSTVSATVMVVSESSAKSVTVIVPAISAFSIFQLMSRPSSLPAGVAFPR